MAKSSALQRLIAFSLSFFSLVLAFFILYIGSSFFIPLAIAIVISYLFIAIAEGVKKLSLIGIFIPDIFAYSVSLALFSAAIYALFFILQNNIGILIDSAPVYQQKLNMLFERISATYSLDFNISRYFDDFNFHYPLRQIALTVTDIAGHAGIIFVYIIFILIEYGFFDRKLYALFPNKHHRKMARRILRKTNSQVLSYLRIKTALSAFTGICCYLILRLVGVDFADFWAILTFLLNFIPTVGSIVATIFPCLLALLQFETLTPFFIVCSSLIAIHFFLGNILEPRIMGEKFNLSGLVIILSLVIWGKIWGVIGMFLCMPLLMILNIILSNFSRTRPIVVLLSRDGSINNHPPFDQPGSSPLWMQRILQAIYKKN